MAAVLSFIVGCVMNWNSNPRSSCLTFIRMIDSPSVLSLVRYSGQELVQVSKTHDDKDGLQYAIFVFVPSFKILYQSMSSTVSLENVPRNGRLRSRVCPAAADKPKKKR